eukprot:TRINITY_DN17577_c0_g1_i2.p1 TRINITY_DN17577_c0_g1~~TRINITY_DN17577_c0_g1_i2.p1  ORF type:complete len:509 (-),score=104.06 TRINITY_DN17577_c0_g1_i2:269-1795(-)
MGSVTSCNVAKQPPVALAAQAVSDTLAFAGVRSGCGSGSQSSQSACLACTSEYKDVFSRLRALELEAVEFSQIQVYRQPLATAPVGEHHGLVYCYKTTFGVPMRLLIDWGQDGLSFKDALEAQVETEGRSLFRAKECGLLPNTLSAQLRQVANQRYCLVTWNCQHFSQHFFQQAAGNWHLNAMLAGLQDLEVELTRVSIYSRAAAEQDANGAEKPSSKGAGCGLVYWYTDVASLESSGIQLEWVSNGLQFKQVATGDHTARSCGLPAGPGPLALTMTGASVGVVATKHVDSLPGPILRQRECRMTPQLILSNLREIEGRAFEQSDWNCDHFSDYMFKRALRCGGLADLMEHLDDLAEDGVELSSVQEVVFPELCHEDLYPSLRPQGVVPAISCMYTRFDRSVILMMAIVDNGLLIFSESDRLSERAVIKRIKVDQQRKRKSTLYAKLPASELKKALMAEFYQTRGNGERRKSLTPLGFCDMMMLLVPGQDKLVTADKKNDMFAEVDAL